MLKQVFALRFKRVFKLWLTNGQKVSPSFMVRFLTAGVFLICLSVAVADSGGPYVGVPDLKPSESPPTFAITTEVLPLRFFLTHLPKLRLNKQFGEPDSYDWQPCKDEHASVSSLGQISGREILCVRYISKLRIDQGLAYADKLLLLARKEDTGPNPELCSPIFYTCDGPSVFDHKAEYYSGDGGGSVVVTRYLDGTGGFRERVYICGDGKRGFMRFTPTKPAK